MEFAYISLYLAITVVVLIASFIYYMTFSRAIKSAIQDHENKNRFDGSWIFIFVIFFAEIAYFFIAVPNFESFMAGMVTGSSFIAVIGIFILAFEIPYVLVKMAAKDYIEQIAAAGDDKRQAARVKSAEVLADIVRRKLKVSCELQAITSNDEFVFLTYIVNNKPIATRLKLNQADNAESWKKLGDWLITNYQAQNP
jgi:hypothetical protein